MHPAGSGAAGTRRLAEPYLPFWEEEVEVSRLIQTLIAAMALKQRSGLTVASLRTILKVTGGVTSRVFIMIKSLAVEAIETGEERITDDAVQFWQPIWAKHAWRTPHRPMAEFG
ncbi:MAG: hypothetical protein KBT70_04510 [Roseovarius sp.]|uniref:Uncharacterized protein n=1 Tax=Aquicoccus porphyridii TaxID=1852029 RepID=A0A5A9YY60_9RHOB|nr:MULTISPECIES: hypothetical protein [Rhodobacterales]KAA0909953.1 hypothetical protein FLO80_19025 [Aquicoccus porphyridii]MBQ0749442.1 hypothetical protein [Roseovarius sp.]MBQ0808649.1 hypothetical protein [Roseovarius sp.]RAI52050.1 hypothetical protein DOO74_19865 [Rhodobacteraceae bacterium AsT-22]